MRALALVLVCLLAGCDNAPSVTINGELLVGKRENGVASFLGVPFAEPPVGDLRWRAPQPLRTRVERRDATQFAAACMQSMRILDWYRYMAEVFGASRDYYDDLEISEDCLYLNLWTPSLDTAANLPVMVWVHGGSNRSGWSFENNYRGHVLAPQGVVVVTVAYRQGAFGFLSHPDLDGEPAVANFGLWDLIAALQWIQDNIAAFGGDPDRVTLFGESSGAENIFALAISKPANHLFHRGVLQSTAGFGLDMPDLDDEMARGAKLARLVGAKSLDNLRQVDARELLETYEHNFSGHYHAPALDGQLLDSSTWMAVQNHELYGHDLIIGTNAAEWLDSVDKSATETDVVATAQDSPRVGGEAALEFVADEDDPRRAMDRLLTAAAMLCPSQNVAANRSASGGNAWMYWFSRKRQDDGGKALGAYHGAEYAYVFGVHDSYMTTTQHDLELSAAMQQYWINFAATGNPNGNALPEWPLFESPNPVVLELGDSIRQIPAPEPGLCLAFEDWNRSLFN